MKTSMKNSVAWSSNIYVRGFTHMAVNLLLAVSVWVIPRPNIWYLWLSITVMFFFFEMIRFQNWRLNQLFFAFLRPVLRPEEWWHPTGAYYVILSAMAVSFSFSPEIAVVSFCFLGVGDAASGMIGDYLDGQRWAKFYRSIACLMACLAAGMGLHSAGIVVPGTALIFGALISTIADAWHGPIDDNVLIPLMAGWVMSGWV
jgi:dolichol kinase